MKIYFFLHIIEKLCLIVVTKRLKLSEKYCKTKYSQKMGVFPDLGWPLKTTIRSISLKPELVKTLAPCPPPGALPLNPTGG